jgi:hypothetical protein
MSSQAPWPDPDIDGLARANSFRSDAAPGVNDLLLSRDFYEAVLQRAKRDRAAFWRSIFTRLFCRP